MHSHKSHFAPLRGKVIIEPNGEAQKYLCPATLLLLG
jgi:hypothetical protein